MNLKNLKIFRDGFQKLMEDGIVTQETFDMAYFRSIPENESSRFYSKDDCGTVGCFLGWSPLIKCLEAERIDFMTFTGSLDFDEYCSRTFNIDSNSLCYNFLFSGNWCYFDNTPEGALARLDVVLSGDFKYLDKHFLPDANDTIVIGEVGDVYIF